MTADFTTPEVNAAREKVDAAIAEYATALRPDETPMVMAWVVGIEWTNQELEDEGRAGRDIIMPQTQTLSASGGLGTYIARRFSE